MYSHTKQTTAVLDLTTQERGALQYQPPIPFSPFVFGCSVALELFGVLLLADDIYILQIYFKKTKKKR